MSKLFFPAKKHAVDSWCSLFIFLLALLIGGAHSVHLGKDLTFDLANYHYYAPYAFFHHRWQLDYWPFSFVNIYFNPTLDFLTYFLIQSFSSLHATFLIGAIQGLNLWVVYRIAHLLLKQHLAIHRVKLLAFILAAVGFYNPDVFTGLGSYANDLIISLLELLFIFFQLKWFENFQRTTKHSAELAIIAGTLLGMAMGLKGTAILAISGAFCAFLSLFLIHIRDTHFRLTGLRLLFSILLGFIFGFLCVSGEWMLFLWKSFHNPFLPYFHLMHTHLMPQNSWQTFFFPFYFSWESGLVGRWPSRDFRYPILYSLLIIYGGYFLWKKFKNSVLPTFSLAEQWLILFFIFSYIFWQQLFSVPRYNVALDMLAPLLIYLLLEKIVQNRLLFSLLTAMTLTALIITMKPAGLPRAQWYEGNYFNVQLPLFVQQIPSALVLMAYPAYTVDGVPDPQSYLIPSFPARWQFMGVPFLHMQYDFSPEVVRRILKYTGKNIFLLADGLRMRHLYAVANSVGLVSSGPCGFITSHRQYLMKEDVLLCPVMFNHAK